MDIKIEVVDDMLFAVFAFFSRFSYDNVRSDSDTQHLTLMPKPKSCKPKPIEQL